MNTFEKSGIPKWFCTYATFQYVCGRIHFIREICSHYMTSETYNNKVISRSENYSYFLVGVNFYSNFVTSRSEIWQKHFRRQVTQGTQYPIPQLFLPPISNILHFFTPNIPYPNFQFLISQLFLPPIYHIPPFFTPMANRLAEVVEKDKCVLKPCSLNRRGTNIKLGRVKLHSITRKYNYSSFALKVYDMLFNYFNNQWRTRGCGKYWFVR